MDRPFVPAGFDPPSGLATDRFVLEPLGPEHNERDHRAWMSSIDHIHATPGFDDDPENADLWPVPMSLEENLVDLEDHARDFRDRTGFTYTVLDPATRDVIGRVYIYPSTPADHDARVRSWVRASHADLDARVRSWVRASHADLDGPLRSVVSSWLTSGAWSFGAPRYDGPAS